jgi:O6-methylguanine-DNA--protein-cysteine methyltransferase
MKWIEILQRLLSESANVLADIPFTMAGTPFQVAVWNAIRQIPIGQVETYAQVAMRVGKPKAVRAVASACRGPTRWPFLSRATGSSNPTTLKVNMHLRV